MLVPSLLPFWSHSTPSALHHFCQQYWQKKKRSHDRNARSGQTSLNLKTQKKQTKTDLHLLPSHHVSTRFLSTSPWTTSAALCARTRRHTFKNIFQKVNPCCPHNIMSQYFHNRTATDLHQPLPFRSPSGSQISQSKTHMPIKLPKRDFHSQNQKTSWPMKLSNVLLLKSLHFSAQRKTEQAAKQHGHRPFFRGSDVHITLDNLMHEHDETR